MGQLLSKSTFYNVKCKYSDASAFIIFFSLYQDVAFGYKKLISDPDVLALIFETLAGCRITENNMDIRLCWS